VPVVPSDAEYAAGMRVVPIDQDGA